MTDGHLIKKYMIMMGVFVTLVLIIVANLMVRSNNHTITVVEVTEKSSKSIVWYTHTAPKDELLTCYNGTRVFNCNLYSPEFAPERPEAYIFNAMEIDRFPLPRDKKTIWGLINDETPKIRPMFMHEKALNLFNFSSTFSRNSDVPMPLLWMRSLDSITSIRYFVNTSMKNSLLNKISPVVFFQSNCFTLTERDMYVRTLMNYIQVDSYGLCLRNKNLPINNMAFNSSTNPCYGDELMEFLARYKFMIAIENAVCLDYVTEKFWRVIELGVVPIYYGSPLIKEWLPNDKSAILLEDFPTPELLSQHLHYLLHNDTAYEEYLEHKTLRTISNRKLIDEISVRDYQNDIDSVKSQFKCFICERLHDKDNSRVNIVTKKQYDCPVPKSALTQEVNLKNVWHMIIKDSEESVNQIHRELEDSNRNQRASNTTWSWSEIIPIQ